MSNEIRIPVHDITGNQSVETQTTTTEKEKLLKDLEEQIKDQSNKTHDKEKQQTKIQKVPEIMLQYSKNKSYYKPREVSIGPIYAESSKLSKRDLKIKLAAKFVMGSDKTSEALLRQIKDKVKELRKCFDERVIEKYDDDDRLSQLLFLDGCFLLQFVESYLSDSLKDFKITNGEAAVISNDLLLFENQIPFLVLILLMESCQAEFRTTLMEKVVIFVTMNVPIGYPKDDYYLKGAVLFFLGYQNYSPNPYAGDWVHLLDFLRKLQIFGVQNLLETEDQNNYIFKRRGHGCFSPRLRWIKQLFGLINTIILRITCCDGEPYPSRSFRNVQELKLAGITLRPSGSDSLKDISFSTKYFISGQLKLPSFVVDNSTARKLLNLVAYEMCMHDYETNCLVTSYVNFLDRLIDNEQDVKDLRAAHILRNHLSSDPQVAQLINDIGYSCRTAPKDAYLNVKNEIQRHYDRKIAIWMAQFCNDHFKSPWSVIALLAAVIILFLTAVQTWYAVFPKKN